MGEALAPYEVWLGNGFGDTGSGAVQCGGTIHEEPSPEALPAVVSCASANQRGQTFVTVRQVGEPLRNFHISELIAYEPAPAPAAPRARDVAREVAARYERGRPSDKVAEAGVLVHVFDEYEDWKDGRPWQLCYHNCYHNQAPDHFSASFTWAAPGNNHPWGWDKMRGRGRLGFILSPQTEILCAYEGDGATGLQTNGGCGACSADGCESPHPGRAHYRLSEALRGHGNEIVIGELYWRTHLPAAIEAFVAFDDADLELGRTIHRSFLATYGLSAAQVPLLRFTGASMRAADDHPRWEVIDG